MYRRVPSFSSSCLLQAKDVLHADHVDAANTQNAEINLGYTTVSAPFNGVVTARKVSIGELVGGSHTTELAIIIRIDPIWV
jgi:multidrug resistance efflux pump